MRAHGLEFVQKNRGAGRREGIGRRQRAHRLCCIEGRRRAEEDGPLDEHVEALETLMISISGWLPCASIVKDALMKLLQECEIGGRTVEELSAFARVQTVVVSSCYSTVHLRISRCIMITRRVSSWWCCRGQLWL
jgi:hypothetical protein